MSLLKKFIGIIIPLLLCAMMYNVAADDTEDNVYVIADFKNGADNFIPGENVESTDSMVTSDGNRDCLEVVTKDVNSDLVRTISANLGSLASMTFGNEDGLDLFEYQGIEYQIFVSEYEYDKDAEYFTRIVLTSLDGSSTESITEINPMVWNTVEVDIAAWRGRCEISSVEISLILSTDTVEKVQNDFYIDDIVANKKIDRSHTERYSMDVFESRGGNAYYDDDEKYLVMELSESEKTSLKAAFFPTIPNWETNSLRIRIENNSDIDSLTVVYSTYEPDNISEEKSTVIRIDRQSALKSYYVDVGNISNIKYITFQADAGEGSIKISSICAVSKYTADKYTTCGNITGCTFTDDLLSVRFTGDIGRDEALSNQSGTLLIYAVEPNTNIEHLDLSTLVPIVESPMTTKFDLTVELMSDELLYMKKFIAVSKRTDGSYVLVDDPFYLEGLERMSKYSIEISDGKKGIVTDDISLISELRGDVTMLDIDVSEAFGNRSKGESYIFGGITFYINRAYFETLKSKIHALSGVGVGVYLRITGWSENFGANLVYNYISDGYMSYSDYDMLPSADEFLAALGAYIGENFCTDGSVMGVVFGECENFIGQKDGKYDSVEDMAKGAAYSLRALYSGLANFNSKTKIYFSISNLLSTELAASTSEVGADEFIPALMSEIKLHGNFECGLCIEDFYRLISYDDSTFSADNSGELITLLRSAGVYDTGLIFCDSNYSFFDMTVAEKMARVAKSYYSASFNSHIDAVFCTVSAKDMDSRFGEMVKEIDSEYSEDISSLVLDYMEVDSWKDVIEDFDNTLLKRKTLLPGNVSFDYPKGIKGSYGYFTFDSFSNDGIEAGAYCSSITVDDNKGVLKAILDPDMYGETYTSGYMGIYHKFEYPENMKLTPVLEFKLEVETENTSDVEIKIVLDSGDDRYEANAVIPSGEVQTLYVDIGNFVGIRDVESIQILVSKSSGDSVLSIYGINGLSRDYNNESLESVIADERAKKRAVEVSDGYGNYLWIGGGVIVACATVLTIMLLSRKKEEDEDE